MIMKATPKIKIHSAHFQSMIDHVQQQAPLEACGILAGKDGMSTHVIPVTNMLGSPVAYRMEPKEQLQAMLLLEDNGWDLLGIFHSHPQGPASPSDTDIHQASYPDSVYLILFPTDKEWICRGFSIDENGVNEVQIEVVSQ